MAAPKKKAQPESSSSPNPLILKIKRYSTPAITILIAIFLVAIFSYSNFINRPNSFDSSSELSDQTGTDTIDLPFPSSNSSTSLEKAIKERRTYRNFQDKPLTINNISQLLWAGQGVTASWGGRTVYSTKSTYPLTLYLIVNQVTDLDQGFYQYIPGDLQPAHQLVPLISGNVAGQIADNTVQNSTQKAAATIVLTGDFLKMSQSYDDQFQNHKVYLEAGAAAQNIQLQAQSLGLGLVTINDFDTNKIREILELPDNQAIIYLIPVGYPVN